MPPAKEGPTDHHWPATPEQSPLFHIAQAARYARREDIQTYEQVTGRSLVVFWGPIFPYCVPYFFDAVNEIDQDEPLDLMITSDGGDPEVSLQMANICRSGRSDFRVIVPERAASSATLLALAADSILMSSPSVLGPIDPQIYMSWRSLPIPAKSLEVILDEAISRIQADPQLFELYSVLLADIDANIIQKARDAIQRTAELGPEIIRLRQNPPTDSEIRTTLEKLQDPASHAAAIVHDKARQIGIPSEYINPRSPEWDRIWRLHTKYVYTYGYLEQINVIEGHRVFYEICPPDDPDNVDDADDAGAVWRTQS